MAWLLTVLFTLVPMPSDFDAQRSNISASRQVQAVFAYALSTLRVVLNGRKLVLLAFSGDMFVWLFPKSPDGLDKRVEVKGKQSTKFFSSYD